MDETAMKTNLKYLRRRSFVYFMESLQAYIFSSELVLKRVEDLLKMDRAAVSRCCSDKLNIYMYDKEPAEFYLQSLHDLIKSLSPILHNKQFEIDISVQGAIETLVSYYRQKDQVDDGSSLQPLEIVTQQYLLTVYGYLRRKTPSFSANETFMKALTQSEAASSTNQNGRGFLINRELTEKVGGASARISLLDAEDVAVCIGSTVSDSSAVFDPIMRTILLLLLVVAVASRGGAAQQEGLFGGAAAGAGWGDASASGGASGGGGHRGGGRHGGGAGGGGGGGSGGGGWGGQNGGGAEAGGQGSWGGQNGGGNQGGQGSWGGQNGGGSQGGQGGWGGQGGQGGQDNWGGQGGGGRGGQGQGGWGDQGGQSGGGRGGGQGGDWDQGGQSGGGWGNQGGGQSGGRGGQGGDWNNQGGQGNWGGNGGGGRGGWGGWGGHRWRGGFWNPGNRWGGWGGWRGPW
ncbi:unnamed protein product [Caenorhabditis auriculariae]|uniref:Uncharacterized protein n=1 Tax=Caenorhabditis auriculariae TaxID=2777116 RepID=A0A8S1HUG0_9PELO|nr:unnamed protein product [Caenorhabditis auriculariae]